MSDDSDPTPTALQVWEEEHTVAPAGFSYRLAGTGTIDVSASTIQELIQLHIQL